MKKLKLNLFLIDKDTVHEAKSAKRRAKDKAKRERLKREAEDAKQQKFQATNAAYLKSIGKLDEQGKLKKSIRTNTKKLNPKKRNSKSIKQQKTDEKLKKRNRNKQLIQKLRKDGIIQKYHINSPIAEELKSLQPKDEYSSGYSIAPTKGKGKALLSVSNGRPKKKPGESKKDYSKRVSEKRKKNLELVRKYKDNPSESVARHFHDEIIKSLVLEHGSDDILYKIEQIVTPPITADKGEKSAKNSLIYKVSKMLADTLGVKYDYKALGAKDFESKKQGPQAQRIKKWESFLKKLNISPDKVDAEGDILFIDDIMTTGSTNKVLKEKLKKSSLNHGGKSPVRGKIHSRIILKNH